MNKLVLDSIKEVKAELAYAKANRTKQEQLEVFKRLIDLYACLNLDESTDEVEVQIPESVA